MHLHALFKSNGCTIYLLASFAGLPHICIHNNSHVLCERTPKVKNGRPGKEVILAIQLKAVDGRRKTIMLLGDITKTHPSI